MATWRVDDDDDKLTMVNWGFAGWRILKIEEGEGKGETAAAICVFKFQISAIILKSWHR